MKKAQVYTPTKTSAKKFNGSYRQDSLYDKNWFRYRAVFLRHNKQCYVCAVEATVVDHIVAHKGNRVKFEAINNHLPLCKKCHDTITALFDRGPIPLSKEKIEWIDKKRLENNVNIVVKGLTKYKD